MEHINQVTKILFNMCYDRKSICSKTFVFRTFIERSSNAYDGPSAQINCERM